MVPFFPPPAASTMKPAQHPNALRIQQLLDQAGLTRQVVEFDQPTRSSAEAAAAIGCQVGEIAKSVVFRSKPDGQAVIIVASGDNRVCEDKVAARLACRLGRANADFVREKTGYVIGGVAPLGHAEPARLLLDADLQAYATLWAAAGTPNSVFPLSPEELARITGAEWADIKVGSPS